LNGKQRSRCFSAAVCFARIFPERAGQVFRSVPLNDIIAKVQPDDLGYSAVGVKRQTEWRPCQHHGHHKWKEAAGLSRLDPSSWMRNWAG
jgi:hypothetical protein